MQDVYACTIFYNSRKGSVKEDEKAPLNKYAECLKLHPESCETIGELFSLMAHEFGHELEPYFLQYSSNHFKT
uniref:Peptidase M3A/M3B catalytic domain-containing protein n=1 Tax=Panagrolaimus davidi TaxID=227884 RepID=A0A914PUN2_9BILA